MYVRKKGGEKKKNNPSKKMMNHRILELGNILVIKFQNEIQWTKILSSKRILRFRTYTEI